MSLEESEREKYRRAYTRERYRSGSPHKRCLPRIQTEIAHYKPAKYANFGCGSGLLDRHLLQRTPGILVDHVSVLWDDVKNHKNLEKFIEGSLFGDFDHFRVPYAVSTDVMEHIPTEMVDKVLENIASRAEICFFQISMNHSGEKDEQKYGGHLHLTVERPDWWTKRLSNWYETLLMPTVDQKLPEAPWEPTKEWFCVTATNSRLLKGS